MSRRAFDWYPTPAWATEILLDLVEPKGLILEPCAGDGAIVKPLRARGRNVYAQDIDPSRELPISDAASPEAYRIRPDWVISNPPFNQAMPIVRQAVASSRLGVAMLLRLSFLEPTAERGPWLESNPPTWLIVLPRISFTGDGKTDSVTCAWVVWDRQEYGRQRISVIPKANKGVLLQSA